VPLAASHLALATELVCADGSPSASSTSIRGCPPLKPCDANPLAPAFHEVMIEANSDGFFLS
jgi:hypothetical protein